MIRVGSLCTGYGGLDMGLALALGQPIEHAWFVEYDGQNRKGELTGPKRLLAHRYPDVHNYGDVKTTDWHEVPPVDWLTAGYPCQPFSGAGLRKGADDPRHLWPGVARAISVLRPPNVLLENVRGHVSLGLDAVLGDLAALGYDARWGVVRAADAGAPHNRERIFIVAADAQGDSGRLSHRDGLPALVGRAEQGTAAADARGERHGRGQDGRTLGRVDGGAEGVARERERPRAEPGDRGAQAAALTSDDRRERSGSTRRGGTGPADGRSGHAPDGDAPLRAVEVGDDERSTRGGGAERPEAPAGGGRGAASDADGDGLARLTGLPAGRAAVHGDSGRDADGRGAVVEWGAYAPAVARWERVSGRPAPRPTEPAQRGAGERLSPRFVEWMMGLPAGWVTDVPGLPRNAQLKLLGNGVVPQQAALALRLLGVTAQEVAA